MKFSGCFLSGLLLFVSSCYSVENPRIEIWHGEHQRVEHLGDAQDDFNVLGHVEPWEEVEQLYWSVNGRKGSPMTYRFFRRLVRDGDFNADIPVAWLRKDEPNAVAIHAIYRDGTKLEESIAVTRELGDASLPFSIDWSEVSDPQDVGQYVDGKWELTEAGLRVAEPGYDRIFLIGNKDWTDYEIRASMTIHRVTPETSPVSGGNGVGILWRFAGHVVGGPRNFPAAQPKWGYQPFGAIGWLRWRREEGYKHDPFLQFYPGHKDNVTNYGTYDPGIGIPQAMRLRCVTLPDTPSGEGVTEYSFKIWPDSEPEPADWTWQHVQTSATALRSGGPALLAHHVEVTFGDVVVNGLGTRD